VSRSSGSAPAADSILHAKQTKQVVACYPGTGNESEREQSNNVVCLSEKCYVRRVITPRSNVGPDVCV